jgi:transitional endoplasmic reticulum ATPase
MSDINEVNDPKAVEKAMADFAANLGMMLQQATDRARKEGKASTYKELGLKWDEKSTQITLPANPDPMEVDEAIQNLIDFKALESQKYTIQEFLPGMPHDAAHAFVQVLKARYGWVNPQTKMTAFGPEPPQMVSVRTGVKPEDFVEVPTGKFKLQDVSADVETGFARNPKNKSGSFLSFYITAEVRHDDRKVIQEIITLTRAYLNSNSIYQGKPMRLAVTPGGTVEADVAPTFIDLSKVNEDGLVLTKTNYDLMATTVWTPIRHTAAARREGIPLKRGALLWGEYGTGKTLSALVTAKIAQENGWTFIMLDDPKGLVQALEMAKLYQPAVVFAEDIDRVVVRDRDDKANDVLNTIDGAVQKGAEIITVLTTNHIDRINQGMLRPGRLDALIHVTVPDAEAAIRLVRLYAGSRLDPNEPMTGLGEHLKGYIPAIIAEVVNRSKLSMIANGRQRIIESDLILAAESMKAHSELLQKEDPKPNVYERLGRAFGEVVTGVDADIETINENLNDIDYKAGEAKNYSESVHEIVSDKLPKILKLLSQGPNGSSGGSGINPADVAEMKTSLTRIGRAVGVSN